MTLNLQEMQNKALEFSKEFYDATRECSETQTFYNKFFEIFGINRRRVATFEAPVKKLSNDAGRIDLFWRGKLLVEQKSKGKDLEKAEKQAFEYLDTLKDYELPEYILICDFQTFILINQETRQKHEFQLKDLYKNIELFNFMIDEKDRVNYENLEDVSIKASELIGSLYDELIKSNYPQQDTGIFLTQVLFCLFADD